MNLQHGLSRTRVHRIWLAMKQRCYLKSINTYARYGAKGIRYCERWESFENFLADMGQPPTDKHTLDRIDSAGDYEPLNCRWATMKEQQNNRSNNRWIEFRGDRRTAAQWAEHLGIGRSTIEARIDRYGWSVERALTTPVRVNPPVRAGLALSGGGD